MKEDGNWGSECPNCGEIRTYIGPNPWGPTWECPYCGTHSEAEA